MSKQVSTFFRNILSKFKFLERIQDTALFTFGQMEQGC